MAFTVAQNFQRRKKRRKQPKENNSNGGEENSSEKHQDCALNSLSQPTKPLSEMSNRKAVLPPKEPPVSG